MGSSSGTPVPPGSQLGRFKLIAFLGRGAFGEVYRAHDRQTGVRVSLKLLSRSATAATRAGLEREAAALRHVHHSRIPGIVASGEVAGRLFLALRFVEGQTLRELLAGDRLRPEQARRIARELGEILASCHLRGVVHGDLKPENVVVDRDGHPHLLDFGLAEVRGLPPRGTSGGTPQYMAPEQIRGSGPTERADQYQLGGVLFECLVGRPPFGRYRSARRTLRSRRALPSVPEGVDAELAAVALRALAFDPEERYGSIEDLLEALDSPAEPRSLVIRCPTPPARRRPVSGPHFMPVLHDSREIRPTRRAAEAIAAPILWGVGCALGGPLLLHVVEAAPWVPLLLGSLLLPRVLRRRGLPTGELIADAEIEGILTLGWGAAIGALLSLAIPGFCGLGPCLHGAHLPFFLWAFAFAVFGIPVLIGGVFALGPLRVGRVLGGETGRAVLLEAFAPGAGHARQGTPEMVPVALLTGLACLVSAPLGLGLMAGGMLWALSILAVLSRGIEERERLAHEEARLLLDMEEASVEKARCQAGMAILTARLVEAARRRDWRPPVLERGHAGLEGEAVRILVAAIPEAVGCFKEGRLRILQASGGVHIFCDRHNLCPAPLPAGLDREAATRFGDRTTATSLASGDGTATGQGTTAPELLPGSSSGGGPTSG